MREYVHRDVYPAVYQVDLDHPCICHATIDQNGFTKCCRSVSARVDHPSKYCVRLPGGLSFYLGMVGDRGDTHELDIDLHGGLSDR